MSFTYSGDPSTSDLDQVRFLIQDTDTNDQLLQNEEIQFLIDENGVATASWKAAETIAAKFARFTDRTIGDFSEDLSQRVEQYNKIAKELKRRASLKTARPFAGGISITDKENVDADTDRVKPVFEKHTHLNPRSREFDIGGVNGDR